MSLAPDLLYNRVPDNCICVIGMLQHGWFATLRFSSYETGEILIK